jgi:ATP-dependent RNA helicase TDRD9
MSATLNSEKMSEYFKTLEKAHVLKLEVPRKFPVKIKYLDTLIPDARQYIDIKNPYISMEMHKFGVALVEKLIKKDVKTILVFLPGMREISTFENYVKKMLLSLNEAKYKIIKLHSTIPIEECREVFTQTLDNKLILASNIAESSITIPDIHFVIDYCLTKHLETDCTTNMTQLKLVWASKMNLEQRAGRCGRVDSGQVIRMIFEDHYHSLENEPKPEMLRSSLENVVLKAKQLNLAKPSEILALAIDPPSRQDIVNAILVLKEKCALSRYNDKGSFDFLDGTLTYVGNVMSKLPIDIRLTKLILLAHIFSVKDDAIIIAAALSTRSIFKSPKYHEMNFFEAKLMNDSSSDLIAYLKVYKKWKKNFPQNKNVSYEEEKKWCDKNMIDLKSIKEMNDQVKDLHRRLNQFKLSTDSYRFTSPDEKYFVLKICIAGAFYPNYYLFGGTPPDKEAFKILCNKNPCTTVYFKNVNLPKNGFAYEDQVKQYLYNNKITDNPDDALVTFDSNSSRVLVEFQNQRQDSEIKMPGEVQLAVYKALRNRRHNNHKLTLCPIPDEKMSDLINDFNQNELKKTRLASDISLSVGRIIEGKITHVISPSEFYFQSNKESMHSDNLKRLMQSSAFQQISDNYYPDNKNVIIKLNDNDWERALIVECPAYDSVDGMYKVLLIDHGSVISCNINCLYSEISIMVNEENQNELMEEIFRLPPLCSKCKVAYLKPSVFNQSGWSEKAISEFKKLTIQKKVDLKVHYYNNYDKMAMVEIFTIELRYSINKLFTERGYAEKTNESFITLIGDAVNDLNKIKHIDTFGACLQRKIELDGPFSPIVVTNFEKIRRAYETQVTVDMFSVNGVLFDQYPFNGVQNVLVAASGSKNDKGNIVLKQTTLMPPLKGLSCLLGLIFSTYAEMRYNHDETRCTNILFGLGCDFYNKPYFVDHDILLHVDVELDNQDFDWINELRKNMSDILVGYFDQRSIHKATLLLLKIMKKERLQTGLVYSSFDWNDTYKRERSSTEPLYQQHNYTKLKKISKAKKNVMMQHLNELEYQARCSVKNEQTRCEACEEDFSTIFELKSHILMDKHVQMRNKYNDEN